MSKKRLDYLAIPDSSGKIKKDRKKKAVEEIHKRAVDKVVILKGRNSEEDILYLGKIVKKGDRVGIDTFPMHYKEYLEIIEKAKKEKKFPKGVKVEHVYINQPLRRFIYGILGWLEERFNRKKLYYKKRNKGFFQKIRDFVKRLLSP